MLLFPLNDALSPLIHPMFSTDRQDATPLLPLLGLAFLDLAHPPHRFQDSLRLLGFLTSVRFCTLLFPPLN